MHLNIHTVTFHYMPEISSPVLPTCRQRQRQRGVHRGAKCAAVTNLVTNSWSDWPLPPALAIPGSLHSASRPCRLLSGRDCGDWPFCWCLNRPMGGVKNRDAKRAANKVFS